MGSTDSSSCSRHPHLPPGFRFHPTDEELVVHYLKRKASSAPLPVAIIAEIDLYKFDPWELPSMAAFGDQEWYFFSPRDRKYPNGARPNRAATSGYWKATGTDKPILTSNGNQKVGVKKALVFYGGKPPKGVKTNWIMHEYRLSHHTSIKSPSLAPNPLHANKRNSLRLDDWVLCRIYKKSNNTNNSSNLVPIRPTLMMNHDHDHGKELISMDQTAMGAMAKSTGYGTNLELQNEHGNNNFFDGMILAASQGMQNGSPGSSSSSKRFYGDLNYSGASSATTVHEENCGSFVSLLSQIPTDQTATFHLGGDGVLRQQQFQLEDITWN